MAGSVVERLIIAFGAEKLPGADAAIRWYSNLSAVAVLAGASIAGAAVATAAEVDNQAKLARSLGQTTEEYTALTFALERGGVTTEQAGTLMRSLQMRVAAVGAGSKEAAADFARLGVRVRDSSGNLRTAADLLPDVIRGLEGLPEGDRLSMQLRLLGESGGALATVIAGGADELERMEDRARLLGAVIDNDTAAASERLTDSVSDLRAVLRGARIQLVSAFIPGVADATDGLVDFLAAEDGIVKAGLDRAVRGVALAMDFLATPAGRAASGLALAGAAVAGVRGAPGLVASLARVSPAAGAAVSGLGRLLAVAGPAAIGIGAVALILEDLVIGAQGGDSAILGLAESMGVGEEASMALAGAGDLLTSAWDATGAVMTGAKAIVLGLGEAVASVFPSLQPMIDALKEMELLSGGLTWIGEQFSDAAEGYGKLARFAMGDETVQIAQGSGLDTSTDRLVAGGAATELAASGAVLLASAARAESRDEDVFRALDQSLFDLAGVGAQQSEPFGEDWRRFGATPQVPASIPSVTRSAEVNVDVRMDARRTAMDAGREVEGQVYAALSELEAL